QIARGQSESTVVVLCSASSLIDPVTGEIQRWTEELRLWQNRAILVSSPPTATESAELKSHTWLPVTAGAIEEIRRVAQSVDVGAAARMPPEDRIFLRLQSGDLTDIDGLREMLGADVFRWLCACALHYELCWTVTIALSQVREVLPSGPEELGMFVLFRLPW